MSLIHLSNALRISKGKSSSLNLPAISLMPLFFKSIAPCSFQQERFAGHSKWQNIRHIKAANDAKKGVAANRFSSLIRK